MISRRKVLSILGLGSFLPSDLTASTSSPTAQHLQHTSALDSWKNQTRHPVPQSNDSIVKQLIDAACDDQPIAFYYFGGSSPRQLRLASVESVFRINDSTHTYISAYCHLRREHRTFRADKVSLA